MSSRLKVSQMVIGIVLAVIAIVSYKVFFATKTIAKTSIPLSGNALWASHLKKAPNFTLIDQNGHKFSLSAQRGKVILVTFMDSLCTTTCPVEAQQITSIQNQIKNLPVEVVVISTDPKGDTPSNIAAFVKRYGWNVKWYWLNGTTSAVQKVWNNYQISVQSANGHSTAVYLVSKAGYERVGLGVPFGKREIIHDLKLLSKSNN